MTIKVISYDGLDASVEENNSSLMVQKNLQIEKVFGLYFAKATYKAQHFNHSYM